VSGLTDLKNTANDGNIGVFVIVNAIREIAKEDMYIVIFIWSFTVQTVILDASTYDFFNDGSIEFHNSTGK
jgi:hypothetical protein